MRPVKTGHLWRRQLSDFTSLTVVFAAGSIYDRSDRKGVSHLMEHLISKVLDKYEDKFTRECIDNNAVTNFDYVYFYFRGLASVLTPEFKHELVDQLVHHAFDNITEEEFELEKQVVLQEITDAYDDPFLGNLQNIYYRYYNQVEPGGFPDHVKEFTFEEAKQMYLDKFTKPLRIVEVNHYRTDFSDIECLQKAPCKLPISFKKTKKQIMPAVKGEKAQIFALCPKIVKSTDYQYMSIAFHMLLDGFKSPIMQELRVKRGLTYDVSYNLEQIQNHSIAWLYMMTDQKNVEVSVNLLKHMCKNIREYLTEDRFKLIIEYLENKRKIWKYFQWKDPERFIHLEHAQLPIHFNHITYEDLVCIVERYLYDIEFVIC